MLSIVLSIAVCVAGAAAAVVPNSKTSGFTYDVDLNDLSQRETPQYITECKADRNPKWEDCEPVIKQINETAGYDPNYWWAVPTDGNKARAFAYGTCAIYISFETSQGFQQYYVDAAIATLKHDCQVNSAGGYAKLGYQGWTMAVQVLSDKSFKRDEIQPAERDETLDARDEDDKWIYYYKITNASPEYTWFQIQNGLPSGGSWTLTESDQETWSISSTATLDAGLFGIFSLTMSITGSYEQTQTNTVGQTIPCQCPQGSTGILMFAPKFTQYIGRWDWHDGTSTDAEILIPLDDGVGDYKVQCSEQH